MDLSGNGGSPVILLEELQFQRSEIENSGRRVEVYFNDKVKKKAKALAELCGQYSLPCIPRIEAKEFAVAYADNKRFIGSEPSLVFLDQCGVRHVDRETFVDLSSRSLTDVLFFFASSFQRRFNEQFSNDLDIPKEVSHKEVHRKVAQQFRHWVPKNYFVGDYSIKKGSNIYGLVFGSGHWLGMLKFLQIVWKDELGGDANFAMEEHKLQGELFGASEKTKLELIADELLEGILSREFQSDGEVSMRCIVRGVLPSKVAGQIYRDLKKQGKLNYGKGSGPRTGDESIRDPRPLVLSE